MQTEDIVIDQLPTENVYVRASAGKRFLNYIIDMIAFYLVFIGVVLVVALNSPSTVEGFMEDSPGSAFLDRILSLFLYALFMSLIEAAFRGKSLGKLITGTRAINLDGSEISTTTAFGRGLSRAVPFCVFSAFGNPCNPWQDKWTDTMVIDERQSRIS
jgi:uncharacterized RDD family membrane protein YckC